MDKTTNNNLQSITQRNIRLSSTNPSHNGCWTQVLRKVKKRCCTSVTLATNPMIGDEW